VDSDDSSDFFLRFLRLLYFIPLLPIVAEDPRDTPSSPAVKKVPTPAPFVGGNRFSSPPPLSYSERLFKAEFSPLF